MTVHPGHTVGERRGFTMIEMLLVVTVMGLVAMLSLGKTAGMIAGWRVNRAAQAFSEELQSGFALVGRNRKPMSFIWNASKMELRIADRNDTTYRRRNFGPTSEFKLASSNMTFSRTSLEVYPPGLAADSLSVVFSQNGKARRVRMLRGGLVQICSTGATTSC